MTTKPDVAATEPEFPNASQMVDFFVESWVESDGRLTWCVRQIVYRPDRYFRQVVSWHETRREAQEERDRLAAR